MIAIDLGSNTLRAIEIDCDTLAFGRSFERMVKTADGLKSSGKISDAAIERVIEALQAMKKELDFDTQQVVAKTTAAMRMATNTQEALEQIYNACGVEFEVIDAKQEAFYTQIAVSKRLETLSLPTQYVLLDVGGGSTELIICDEISKSKSIDVGIVTMSQSYTDQESLIKNLYHELEPFKDFLRTHEYKPKMLVSTAGTPTTMASMKQGLTVQTYDPHKINGTTLNRDELDFQLTRLMAMDETQRALHVGVGRDSLIVTGVEILRVLMDLLDYKQMVVVDDGMREGIAFHSCSEMS